MPRRVRSERYSRGNGTDRHSRRMLGRGTGMLPRRRLRGSRAPPKRQETQRPPTSNGAAVTTFPVPVRAHSPAPCTWKAIASVSQGLWDLVKAGKPGILADRGCAPCWHNSSQGTEAQRRGPGPSSSTTTAGTWTVDTERPECGKPRPRRETGTVAGRVPPSGLAQQVGPPRAENPAGGPML